MDRKLTLIVAPVGYGKTTMLSEWIPQSERCVTWVSLDDGDNDPVRFWACFIAALQMLAVEIGRNSLALLQSLQPPNAEVYLTTLLNEIAAFQGNFVHVLDDFQVIHSQPVQAGVQYFLEHMPPNLHLIISSRVDPPFPLSRLRVLDQLNEIRMEDLRFTPDETAAFLKQTMRLDLSREQVFSLETHSEGWIAGLQLAGLALQSHEQQPDHQMVSDFIQAFTGSNRYIVSYLVEEVLSKQPPGLLNFLLRTSILDRLCGPLCDAVTGEPGGGAILENLEQANLFITPLDEKGVWYRFQYLFAEVLQARLRRSQPGMLRELHTRACVWYEDNGFLAEAVKHARTAGDDFRVADLIERERWTMLTRGEASTLHQWLDQLPEEVVKRSPSLSTTYAWIFSLLRQTESIEPHLRDAETALGEKSTRTADLEAQIKDGILGEIAMLRAAVALSQSNIPRALELCRFALEQIPEENALMRSFATYFLGQSERRGGHLIEAGRFFAQSHAFSLQADNTLIAFHALANLTNIQISMGKLNEAFETSQRILKITADQRRQAMPVAGLAYYGLCKLHYEWNELELAEKYARLGVESGQRGGMTGLQFTCRYVLAQALQSQQDSTGADQVLREIASLNEQHPNPVNSGYAAVWVARLRLRQGQIEGAVRWVDHCGLRADDTDLPYSRELEYLTLAGVRIALGEPDTVTPLINRLEQAAISGNRTGSLISILILKALAQKSQSDVPGACLVLERALLLALPEGYIRSFIDEGKPILDLLTDLRVSTNAKPGQAVENSSLSLLDYIDRLMAVFSLPAHFAPQSSGIIIEPLSDRELEILRLIASGASNAEIASSLFIALSTVKSHANHLFGKLGVNSRTQAIVRAQELALL
jgi:LuxR family maltose regulon positive regulatory protein